MTEQKLGILGGMGPQATQVFYQYVLDRTEASCDQEHLPTLILSDTKMPDRTAAILSGHTQALYERLLRDAKLLENCGCTAIAIPCNTSHYFVDKLQGDLHTPILHMIRETAAAIYAQGRRRPAILATDGTIQSGLYQAACAQYGLEAVAPDAAIQALVMSIIINPHLTGIFLVAILFLLVVLSCIMFPTIKIFDRVFKNYDNLNASVQENVAAIRVVKSFVREQHEDEKYTKACQDLYKQFVKAESRLSFNNPSMLLAVYGCNLALSWFGAHYVLNGIISTGQLNALFGYVMNILMSLMMLSMVFVMLSMSAASAHRIIEVLDETTDLPPAKTPVNEVKDGGVEFDHVTFKYKHGTGKPVLSDITFRIQPGETLGIIGGTGSAKSSLVQLIPRLYDVAEGSVKVGGVDVRDYNLDVLRHDVSMVLQKNVLFSGTILDNLRWGDENATEAECIEACRLACADEFIERFPDKYNTWIEQGGSNVSGGQKQRLTIARALLRKPKVLILDDSTSAVDTATDAKIRQAFREKLPGTTKIIIAQRISSVQDADRILVLDNGQIDGLGTHEELLATNKIYQEVYTSQTQGGGDFDKQGGEE